MINCGEAELEKSAAELHGLMLARVTVDQFQEFSEAPGIQGEGPNRVIAKGKSWQDRLIISRLSRLTED